MWAWMSRHALAEGAACQRHKEGAHVSLPGASQPARWLHSGHSLMCGNFWRYASMNDGLSASFLAVAVSALYTAGGARAGRKGVQPGTKHDRGSPQTHKHSPLAQHDAALCNQCPSPLTSIVGLPAGCCRRWRGAAALLCCCCTGMRHLHLLLHGCQLEGGGEVGGRGSARARAAAAQPWRAAGGRRGQGVHAQAAAAGCRILAQQLPARRSRKGLRW